jgi:WD40 repeat protein
LAENLVVLRGHEGRPGTAAPSPYQLPEVKSPVAGIAASADGRLVASGGQDGTVRIWEVSGGSAPIVLAGDGKAVVHVAVSPSGRQVAAVDEGGAVNIWKTANPAAPTRLKETYAGSPVLDARFMAHGDRLVGFAADGIPYIWNTPESSSAEPDPEPYLGVMLVAPSIRTGWSPDGRHVAGIVQGSVLLWDLEVRDGLTKLPGDANRIHTLAFSPDGAHLAGAADDGTVRIWNIADPAHTGPVTLRGRDQGAVRDMAFSQDSHQLITVGLDATVRAWKTTGTSEPLMFSGFRAAASNVASLADGRYVTAHDDGEIRIWRCLACGPITEVLAQANRQVTRELTSEERQTYLSSSR